MTPRRPLEVSGASPGTPLGAHGHPVDRSRGLVDRFGSIFGRPGGVQGPSGEIFGTLLGDFLTSKGVFL